MAIVQDGILTISQGGGYKRLYTSNIHCKEPQRQVKSRCLRLFCALKLHFKHKIKQNKICKI